MHPIMRKAVSTFFLAGTLCSSGLTQYLPVNSSRPVTYANPIDLAYRFRLEAPSRREAADPTVVLFHGEYWLFASKSGGYWHSKDLHSWQFVEPIGYPIEDYAPTAFVLKDKLYATSFSSKAIYRTDDPLKGQWTKVATIPAFGDPDLFLDDDGKVYIYYGCGNTTPIHVAELDPANQWKVLSDQAIEETRDITNRGWQVPGDQNELTKTPTWIEGAWMSKHGSKYYLQYSAAGTQYKTYADGVLVGNSPLGPFQSAASNPFSFKPTGFITGAGHSSTFQDKQGAWWHIASMTISVRHTFERRLGIFPAYYTPDGELYTDTYLGDYPHRLDGDHGLVGWMLLSYHKPVTASSSLTGHEPELAVDEDVRSWWSAETGSDKEWFQIDMGSKKQINAVQINFADEGATTVGHLQDGYKYLLESSLDSKHWMTLIDHRNHSHDSPHDYEQLNNSIQGRYVRIRNVHTPAGAKFSLSDLRIFGKGLGTAPTEVPAPHVIRDPVDARIATITWKPVTGADFYIVRYGAAADRMFENYQVYGSNVLTIRSLTKGTSYVFAVDAVNENGVTKGTVISTDR